MDQVTRWPEEIPFLSIVGESCCDAFLRDWVAWFGVPSDMSSYWDPQFKSALWSELSSSPGISHHFTTAYKCRATDLWRDSTSL